MQTMERIYRYRMTTTSGGNLSIREDNGDIWITPARVDKGSLKRDDIVCVHPNGKIEGPHKPSSEFPFHKAIYESRPEIRGIVHAHPVALVAFSISRRVPDTRLFHQARRVCGDVGFAPYALPGSQALGRNIAATFAKGFHCVVLENHGVVVGGDNLQDAFQRFETLEFTAKTIIKASLLGDVRYLSDEQVELARKSLAQPPARKPPGATTSNEKELRRQLCEFVRRGYHQRLFISTGGSFSARLDNGTFLITPTDADRHTIDIEDFVLIRLGESESPRRPSRAARLHHAIYARHPKVNAVLNAFPVNATAFGVTQAPLETRTIPESYIFLRDVRRVPFGGQFREPESLATLVSLRQPIAILENDGVLVLGASVLDAFDRLEVLESTAEALINSRPLGEVKPMSDAVIDELTAAFLKD
ncbi:MAG: class II aldolase/adducin family protein [Verrucomicrobiota bacterium]